MKHIQQSNVYQYVNVYDKTKILKIKQILFQKCEINV